MSKHTPGPWKLQTDDYGRARRISSDLMPEWKQCWPSTSSDGRVFVCEFRHYEYEESFDYCEKGQKLLAEVNNANARLIAAAPEMFDALKSIAEYWNKDRNEEAMHDACWQAINTALAAIAKAEGAEVES